jgi:hypothetical protein
VRHSARTARIGPVAGPVLYLALLLVWRADAMGVAAGLTA